MSFETYVDSRKLGLLLHVAEIISFDTCDLADASNNPQAECRKEWPGSTEDWCLSCIARQALEDYSPDD